MSFIDAVKTCFRKYTNFSDPATRPEYWWFALFNFLISIVLDLTGVRAIGLLWLLVILIPSLAVTVRRHHDAGRSGWWILTSLIWPWAVVLLCYPSKLVNNKYAPDRGSGAAVTEASLTPGARTCAVCGKLRLPGQNYCMGCGTKFDDD